MTATETHARQRSRVRVRPMLTWAAVLVVAVAVPLALDTFTVQLVGTYLAFALVALSIDLIWGYTGIVSIGQFAFFGIGAYATAMITTRIDLPHPLSMTLAAIAAALVPALFAAVLAGLFFWLGLGDLFVLVTIAVAVVLMDLATSQTAALGGINGINLPDWAVVADVTRFYYLMVAIVLGVLIAARRALHGRLGSILTAIKENESRLRYLGYNTLVYKVGVFSVSAAICGVAGCLYVLLTGFATPEQLGFALSFDAVVWAVIGGLRSLWGPIIGALAVNYVQFYASGAFIDYWLLILGALFIVAVVAAPTGLAGLVGRFSARNPTKPGRRFADPEPRSAQ